MTESRPKRRSDPTPVGEILRGIVSGRGWPEHLAVGRLRTGWGEVAGPLLAARSDPVRLSDGVLTIRADPGAWATELSMLAPRIAAKADAHLGGGLVREVRVVASARRRE